MEDFYDVKLTEIDGQPVSLFGVFDGTVPNLALYTSAIPFPLCFSFEDLVH